MLSRRELFQRCGYSSDPLLMFFLSLFSSVFCVSSVTRNELTASSTDILRLPDLTVAEENEELLDTRDLTSMTNVYSKERKTGAKL